jgi:hypothetical protein
VIAQPTEFEVIYAAYIHRWGYESIPNTPITVGVVPEPASATLLLMAAPALLRRGR